MKGSFEQDGVLYINEGDQCNSVEVGKEEKELCNHPDCTSTFDVYACIEGKCFDCFFYGPRKGKEKDTWN